MPLHPLLEVRRLHAGRTQKGVDPLLLGEGPASLEQFLQVHVRHLDRLQVAQQEGRSLLILLEEILQRDDAPDAADEQLLELLDDGAGDFDSLDAQVAEQRLVNVPLFVERDRHFVDDLEAAPLPDRGLHLLGFVGPDVVLGQNLFDGAQPFLDHGLVVRGAVTPQQILQDIDRHVRTFLDQLGQVLANDLARKVLVQEIIQPAIEACGFQKSSVNALSIITSTLCCSMPVSASRSTRR